MEIAMQKNKLAKSKDLDFLARLTTALAPADENTLRHVREADNTGTKASRRIKEPRFTAQYLGSV